MNIKQIFEECGNNETPLDVMCVSGSAADNAAATINENGGKFVQGCFTEEFYNVWYMSVQGLLCDSEYSTQEVRDWFEVRGISY